MVLKRPVPRPDAGALGRAGALRPRLLGAAFPSVYYSGDSAHVDEDGYFWFAGRADEIIKIAAHRLGTIEVESAFLKHPAVAECGVVGRPDETRGEVIAAFVLLKHGHAPSAELRQALLDTVRRELGPVAVIGELNFVGMLPKTRSGKIMRRVLKAVDPRSRSRRHHDDRGRGLGRGGAPGVGADEGGGKLVSSVRL